MSTTNKLFLRRGEAEALLGLPEKVFRKLVEAEAIKPLHLVWEVETSTRGKTKSFQTTQVKAEAYIAGHKGATMRPIGKAYFARVELEEFAKTQGGKVRVGE
jgi:hypothetical protein